MKAKKATLRKLLKGKLKEITPNQWESNSKKLSAHLKNLLDHLNIREPVGAFAPLKDEVDWYLGFDQQSFGLPAFENGEMVFRLTELDKLETRSDFGVDILCPPQSATKMNPKVLFVPGLGFSTNGHRLGRGKGFYDRYLEKNEVLTIGVCFEAQIVEEIPREDHDMKVDYVVTEKAIYENGQTIHIGE